ARASCAQGSWRAPRTIRLNRARRALRPLTGEASCAGAPDPLQCRAEHARAKASLLSQLPGSAAPAAPISTEVVVVGAGPCGLFQVFELGLLGIDAHVVDSLAHPGGQCAELYPDKPIYDIPALPGAEAFEGTSIHYRVKSAAELEGKRLVIFGGGDSALDWTLELLGKAASLTLVHRRHEFRAAPASVARMQQHVAAGRMRCFEALPHSLLVEDGALRGVNIRAPDGTVEPLEAEQLLVFFGLHPKLGPIAEWGLALEKKALKVDTEKSQTSLPGVFAVGDINTYPGKKKLILSGFHEAALAAFAIQHHLYPQKKQFLQYTTTSPLMHQRLGVPD